MNIHTEKLDRQYA